MATGRASISVLFLVNALIPLAIGIFAIGFFPYKPFIPGRNVYRADAGHQPPAIFDKLIFMVVDALRSDFVYSNESSFHFVQSLIQNGAALPFTAHATSPTITMPKVKALTTGSIPSFLDVILNFAESDTTSTLAHQDTWLTQLRDKPSGNVLMYGDDTWLKLFPNIFYRSDGTTSFFVSDFTEVDSNVTRHVPEELEKDDWNGMIMHYLGLDHIGHKSGPRSPHMRPKQQEMDEIVRQIYAAIESKPHLNSALLVLCGDHGMNDAGNHGGSAAGETSPALVFMSPKLRKISKGYLSPVAIVADEFQYYEVVEQSDVAPTLAGLLGFPVPLNNLGVFISSMLGLWSAGADRLKLVQQNAEQVYNIVTATFGNAQTHPHPNAGDCKLTKSDGELLHCLWSAASAETGQPNSSEEKIHLLFQFLKHAQGIMSNTASNYDVGKLQLGVIITALSTLAAGLTTTFALLQARGTFLVVLALCLSHGGIMFASSFVEEEHHFWYWSTSAWLISLWAKSLRRRDVELVPHGIYMGTLPAVFRIIRRWNQTGQKYAGAPDIGRTYLTTHPSLLWALIALTFTAIGYNLSSLISARSRLHFAVPLLAVWASVIGFKISFTAADAPELLTDLVRLPLRALNQIALSTQARVVFVGLAWFALAIVIQNRVISRRSSNSYRTLYSLHDLVTILLITQSRANNIPLFLLFQLQFAIMRSLPLSPDDITLASLFMQYSSYFAFGGTNAISSIDLSSAYNGVNSYNVLAVGVLTFVGNWAGPIWWAVGCCVMLLERTHASKTAFIRHLLLHTLFVSNSLMCVMMACTLLRTHLFIWTVFSPKYLYSMAWTLGHHLIVNVFLGCVLWALGADP